MNPEQQQPTPAPAAPQPDTQPAQPAAHTGGTGKSKKGLFIGIGIAIVVVAAAVAYGVYAYVSNSPQNLMSAAVGNLASQKAYAGSLSVATGTGSSAKTVSGSFAIQVDPSNSKNWQGSVSAGGGSVKAMQLSGTLYVQANNLGDLMSQLDSSIANSSDFATTSALFKNINGQWFMLTQDETKTFAQSFTQSAGASTNGSVNYDDLKRVMDIYQQHPFITADKQYNDEVVGGANSAHFSLKLDRGQYQAFLTAVKNANLQTITVTDADINSAKSQPDTPTDGSVEVWVARDTKKFTQFRVTDTKKGEESTMTLTLNSQLPSFDKFVAPTNAKPMSEFFNALIGSSMNGLDTSSFDPSLLTQ